MPTAQDLNTDGFISFGGGKTDENQELFMNLNLAFENVRGTLLNQNNIFSTFGVPTIPVLTEGQDYPP